MKILKYLFGVVFAIGVVWLFVQPASSQTVGVPNTGYSIRFWNVGIGTVGANGAIGVYQTIYTAPTNGGLLKSLTATNYDSTSAHAVNCRIVNPSSIPGMSFYSNVGVGTTGVNLLSAAVAPGLPIEQWTNAFHAMPVNYILQCTYQTTMGSGGYVSIDAQIGEL